MDHFGYDDRQKVKEAWEDLRLERSAARQVLDSVARK